MARVQAGNCLVFAEKCKTKKLTGGRTHRNGYGCGTGYTANVLESEWRMIGMDLSPRIPSSMSETGTRKAVSSRYELLFLTL